MGIDIGPNDEEIKEIEDLQDLSDWEKLPMDNGQHNCGIYLNA